MQCLLAERVVSHFCAVLPWLPIAIMVWKSYVIIVPDNKIKLVVVLADGFYVHMYMIS